MDIMQGDAYSIPITIKSDGAEIDSAVVEAVEIIIGFIKKVYPGEITFNNGAWHFPLRQEESAKLSRGRTSVQVRVKFHDGNVVGMKHDAAVNVKESRSKVII